MEPCTKSEFETQDHGKRVLVVDDDWLVANLACQILERLGYQVDFKTDPLAALEHYRRRQYSFDLVITDMDMPVMTGDQLALEIVKIREDIPIVMCTGSDISFSKEEAAHMGIKAVIMKPLIVNELKELLLKLI